MQDGIDPFVVDPILIRGGSGSCTIGIERATYKSVIGIVFVVDFFDDRASGGVTEDDFGQSIAVVPGIFLDLSGGGFRLRCAIPFVVKRVGESESCRCLIVRACGKTGCVAIPVGIEAVRLVGLARMRCAHQLRCLVVGIGVCSL